MSAHNVAITPRLLSKEQAAAYCGLCPRRFDRLRKDGKFPGPLPGTARWDIRAIDAAIDTLSALGAVLAPAAPAPVETDPLEAWKRKRDERKNRGG